MNLMRDRMIPAYNAACHYEVRRDRSPHVGPLRQDRIHGTLELTWKCTR